MHLLTARDKQRSIQHSLTTFRGRPLEKAAKKAAARAKVSLEERRAKDSDKDSAKSAGKNKRSASRK